MKFVAFYRNLNLGRARCPTRAQFEDAFVAAGAENPTSFQVNGTIVYSARDVRAATAILEAGSAELLRVAGTEERGFLRRMSAIVAIVASDPFAGVELRGVHECCVTFFDPIAPKRLVAPILSDRGDVEIIGVRRAEAFGLSRTVGRSIGSPTAFLEKRLGSPVTSRNWNTLTRLVAKYG